MVSEPYCMSKGDPSPHTAWPHLLYNIFPLESCWGVWGIMWCEDIFGISFPWTQISVNPLTHVYISHMCGSKWARNHTPPTITTSFTARLMAAISIRPQQSKATGQVRSARTSSLRLLQCNAEFLWKLTTHQKKRNGPSYFQALMFFIKQESNVKWQVWHGAKERGWKERCLCYVNDISFLFF